MVNNNTSTQSNEGSDFKAQIRNKKTEITQDLQNLGQHASELAKEALQDFQKNASSYYEKGRDQIQTAEQKLESRVRSNPVRSMIVAGAIGLFAGLLMKK